MKSHSKKRPFVSQKGQEVLSLDFQRRHWIVTPIRSTVPQKDLCNLPLFGQVRLGHEAKQEKSQTSLFTVTRS